MRSLKRRIAALEGYGVGTDDGCVACRHWSPTMSLSVPGSDPSPQAQPPERCRSCGRARRRIIICFAKPREALERKEEQSGPMTEGATAPAEPLPGPENAGLPQDDPSPALATTASVTATADATAAVFAEALPPPATADVSWGSRRSPIAGRPGSEPPASETEPPRCQPWPIYVAARPIDIGRLHLQVGAAFPFQDKRQIRSYGPALGVPDADRRPFRELPYVAVRDSGHRG